MAKKVNINFKNAFNVTVMTLVGFAISMLLVPLLLPLFLTMYVISRCAVVLIKLKYGRRAYKADGMDVLSGKETTESYPIINIAFRFVGKMEPKKFRNRILNFIFNSYDERGRRRYGKLMQLYRKSFGYSIWKEPKRFNIDEHIKIVRKEDIVGAPENLDLNSDSLAGIPNPVTESREQKQNGDWGRQQNGDCEQQQNGDWEQQQNGDCEQQQNGDCEQQQNGDWEKQQNGDWERQQNGDSIDGDWELLITNFLNKYGGEKIKRGIPQWELVLLRENDQRYTALFRFHHSIADGIYVSRMLCEEFLDNPTKLFHSYVAPSLLYKILRNLWSFCLLPFGLWTILKNSDKNVLHGQKLSGKKKFFVSKQIPMTALREIKTQTNTSIHGVLFSCLSAALGSHFERRKETTSEVTTLIPMPMQNLQKQIKLKNRYAVASLKIPTTPPNNADEKILELIPKTARMKSKPLDPLERLDLLKTLLNKAKGDPTFISVHSLITTLCSLLPSAWAEALLSTKGSSVAFSNLPGPQEPIIFEGDLLQEVMFWIPDRQPLGVGVSILSYSEHLRAGLVVDRSLLKDEKEGELLIQNFEKEIENITNCLSLKKKTSAHAENEAQQLLKTIP